MSKTLVIGDVHGCAKELERLIRKVKPSQVYLVGDLFTKGPDPVGVWKLIQKHRIQAVMGNHDAWLIKILDGEVEAKPKQHKLVNRMNAQAPGWDTWVRQLPLFIELPHFTLVHAGLHPSGDLEKTTRDMALLMRHWPFKDLNAPHWHEVYQGGRRVIFGHDAKGGLVYKRKGGQPYVIGLDSGCVYGKKLTGYLIEQDELHQVSAARVYQPIYCV